jgi:succinate-acetate transporter protein
MAKKEIPAWEHTRIFLRPIASGVPLGFFSFGIGMLLLGCAALNIIPVTESKQLGLILALFVFPLEMLAAIFAFLARDTMSVAAMGLFAASWLTLGVFEIVSKPGATSVIGAMALPSKPFYTVLFVVAAARLILAGVFEAGGSHFFYNLSGYLAFAVTLITFYGGVAFTLEDIHQKAVLPLFRRGAAQEAFGGYEQQLKTLESEPGIRHQL